MLHVKGRIKDSEYLQMKRIQNKMSERPGYIIANSCGHYLSHQDLAKKGDKQKNYSDLEVECPICKNPSNLAVPIFKQQTFKTLSEGTSKPVSISTYLTLLLSKLIEDTEGEDKLEM